jgi:hypothetical protein
LGICCTFILPLLEVFSALISSLSSAHEPTPLLIRSLNVRIVAPKGRFFPTASLLFLLLLFAPPPILAALYDDHLDMQANCGFVKRCILSLMQDNTAACGWNAKFKSYFSARALG